MISLERSDFDCIGQVAKHCNYENLCIATEEAATLDLKRLLCDLFFEVETNWESQDAKWNELISGSEYTGCSGNTKKHAGLKKVLTYYSYARYLIINSMDDTPNGAVTKKNDWSLPKPAKEVFDISNRYRTMAGQFWKEVEGFMCLNSGDYPAMNKNNCSQCGCNGSCGEYTNTRGFGLVGGNVSKYD